MTRYSTLMGELFHQACVRVAAADSCNEGRAHTLDGTPIALYRTLA